MNRKFWEEKLFEIHKFRKVTEGKRTSIVNV